MKLFNESLSRSWISSTLESQAWAYDKLDDSTAPVIRQMYRDNIESLIELQYYQFTHPEMNSREAQMKFIEEYGNDPFSLDFQHHYSEMNDYEKALVNWIDGLAWTVIPLWYAWYWLLWSTADAEAKARMMWRFINATNVDYSWWFFSDVWDFGTAGFNWTMLLFQQAESLLSSAVWVLWSLYQSVKDSIDNREISFWDFVWYYYWFQTSKSFTTTETFQQFKNPQTKGEATSKWITDHVSMVDDIVELIAPAKWFTLPGKFAKVEDVIKVIWKVDDTIDTVKWASKLTKIKKATTSKLDDILTAESDEWFSIVSDVQKVSAVIRNVPVKIAVIKNGWLGLVRQYQHFTYNDRFSVTDLSGSPELDKIAEAYGMKYIRVSNNNSIDPGLEEFLKMDESVLMEVDVDPSEIS